MQTIAKLQIFLVQKFSEKLKIRQMQIFVIKVSWSHLVNPCPLQTVLRFREKNFCDWMPTIWYRPDCLGARNMFSASEVLDEFNCTIHMCMRL